MNDTAKVVLFGVVSAACSAGAIDIYVSPTGDDAASGSAAAPLKTLAAARDRARRATAVERVPGVTVWLNPGVYALEEPLELDPSDSGAAGAPVVWRATKRGAACVSGFRACAWSPVPADDPNGRFIPKDVRARVRTATLPTADDLPGFLGDYVSPNDYPYVLFRKGRELPNARWPNDDEWDLPKPEVTKPAKGAQTFAVRTGADAARLKAWQREPDLWAWGAWHRLWADSNAPVLSVDPAAGTIELPAKYVSEVSEGCDEGGQFHIRNAFSEMDRDGEWVADRKNRRLYLLTDAKKGAKDAVVAWPLRLVKATGVCDVVFEGIVFAGSRGDALSFDDCTNVTLRACAVRATGGWGVTVANGARCRFDGCDLFDLGEGGIRIQAGDWRTLTPGGHVVDNCHIHHFGRRIYNYRSGIRLDGVGNRAAHNLIHHTRHAGIIFTGNDQYMGYNIVHDTCFNNFDCGAFYTYTKSDWWARGSVLEYNLAHMTGRHRCGACTTAFYIDGWASGTTLRGNIASRASDGFYQNGGNANTYERNIAICCSRSFRRSNLGLQQGRTPYPTAGGLGEKSYLYSRLVQYRPLFETAPWKDRYPHLLDVLSVKDPIRAHNSFWCTLTNNVAAMGGPISLEDADQMDGTEVAIGNEKLDGEVGFRDYKGFDWELRDDAPARRVTGCDTRWAQMGLYESPWRFSPPVKLGEGVTPPFDGPDRPAPVAIVRMHFPGSPPAGVTEYATNLVNCSCTRWNWPKGEVISVQSATLTARGGWKRLDCSFTPTVSGTVRVSLEGWRGEKTLYDDFEVEGAELENGGFEDERNWSRPSPSPAYKNLGGCAEKPYGIVGNLPGGYAPRTGKGMMAVNVYLVSSGSLRVKAGVPVKLSFYCRGYIPQGCD